MATNAFSFWKTQETTVDSSNAFKKTQPAAPVKREFRSKRTLPEKPKENVISTPTIQPEPVENVTNNVKPQRALPVPRGRPLPQPNQRGAPRARGPTRARAKPNPNMRRSLPPNQLPPQPRGAPYRGRGRGRGRGGNSQSSRGPRPLSKTTPENKALPTPPSNKETIEKPILQRSTSLADRLSIFEGNTSNYTFDKPKPIISNNNIPKEEPVTPYKPLPTPPKKPAELSNPPVPVDSTNNPYSNSSNSNYSIPLEKEEIVSPVVTNEQKKIENEIPSPPPRSPESKRRNIPSNIPKLPWREPEEIEEPKKKTSKSTRGPTRAKKEIRKT